MKIRLTKSFRSYEVYDTIELNPEDYPELEGKSETEIVEYLNENKYDFTVKGRDECLYDQFVFYNDVVRDKIMDEETNVILVQ